MNRSERWVVAALGMLLGLALSLAPQRAAAQGAVGHWTCGSSSQCASVMGGASGDRSFSTMADCEQWGRTNIRGGYTCRAGSGSTSSSSGATPIISCSMKASPLATIVRAAVCFGFPGAVGGALLTKVPDSTNYALTGGLGSAGIATAYAVLYNMKRWSFIGMTFTGAVAGAELAAANASYERVNTIPGSEKDLATTDKISKDAILGAEAGAAGGLVLSAIGHLMPATRLARVPGVGSLARMLQPVSIVNRGRIVGVRVAQ